MVTNWTGKKIAHEITPTDWEIARIWIDDDLYYLHAEIEFYLVLNEKGAVVGSTKNISLEWQLTGDHDETSKKFLTGELATEFNDFVNESHFGSTMPYTALHEQFDAFLEHKDTIGSFNLGYGECEEKDSLLWQASLV